MAAAAGVAAKFGAAAPEYVWELTLEVLDEGGCVETRGEAVRFGELPLDVCDDGCADVGGCCEVDGDEREACLARCTGDRLCVDRGDVLFCFFCL